MSVLTEIEGQVLIPGSYDILSPDHRNFISSCVEAASDETPVDTLTIGLAPDRALARKGPYRPFYTYEWRQNDIRDWYATVDAEQAVYFDEFYPAKLMHALPNECGYALAVLSEEHADTIISTATATLAEKIVYVPPINITHTTDVEIALRTERDTATCNWRVGAVLLRNGEIIDRYHNGGPEPASCLSCSKYTDIKEHEAQTGTKRSSPVRCDFSHAEAQASAAALEGDHLLTSLSPCQQCAESIVASGIKRVVYLRPYHTTRDPIRFLEDNDVEVRQAGLPPDLLKAST